MTPIRMFISCASLVLILTACNEGADDRVEAQAPASKQADVKAPSAASKMPETPGPDSVLPAEVSAAAVTVGTALANGRAVKSDRAQFATSDTVYASASVQAKPGADVSVYWTYQDGTTHKEETQKLKSGGGQPVTFSFGQADGMKPGKYNVEIDLDMTPVGIAEFVIR